MKTPEEWADVLIDNQISIIKQIQDDAYNQCLFDLIADDLLPNKERNIKKYKK
jgi:hypothetical protein